MQKFKQKSLMYFVILFTVAALILPVLSAKAEIATSEAEDAKTGALFPFTGYTNSAWVWIEVVCSRTVGSWSVTWVRWAATGYAGIYAGVFPIPYSYYGAIHQMDISIIVNGIEIHSEDHDFVPSVKNGIRHYEGEIYSPGISGNFIFASIEMYYNGQSVCLFPFVTFSALYVWDLVATAVVGLV